jgi:hypothetical protein
MDWLALDRARRAESALDAQPGVPGSPQESEQTANRNVRKLPRPLHSSPLGRSRRTSGVGRAPAWYPTAYRRRPHGAARHGPCRRRWRHPMRRRPVAAYRVIDEEELLGGGAAWSAADSQPTPASAPASDPRPRRSRRFFRSVWGSTLASVVGMAGIAAVLVASPAHVPVAPAHRLGAATRGATTHRHHAAVALASAARSSDPDIQPAYLSTRSRRTTTRKEPPSLAGSLRHERARRRRSSSSRRVVGVTARSRTHVTAAAVEQQPLTPVATDRVAPPTESPAPASAGGPAAEFGFER